MTDPQQPSLQQPSPREPSPRPRGAGIAAAAASRLSAMLLGAASVAWTATPLLTAGLAKLALTIAIVTVAAAALRLAFADVPEPADQIFLHGFQRAWLSFLQLLRSVPWEEGAVIAILWLEIQHAGHSGNTGRPWHTAALGAALTAYLLATHIAESAADPATLLRRHARPLLAGACLLALAAGLAMIPAAAPGAGSAILRVLAAVAVIAATALVLVS
jgi:hypothetical protein